VHRCRLGSRIAGGDEIAEPGPFGGRREQRLAVVVGPGPGMLASRDGPRAESGGGGGAAASPNWTAVCQARTS